MYSKYLLIMPMKMPSMAAYTSTSGGEIIPAERDEQHHDEADQARQDQSREHQSVGGISIQARAAEMTSTADGEGRLGDDVVERHPRLRAPVGPAADRSPRLLAVAVRVLTPAGCP